MNQSAGVPPAPIKTLTPVSAPIERAAAEETPAVPGAAGLAQCLSAKGVKFYGAFWCPHCTDQKKLFGTAAAAALPYIECDPRGQNPNPRACIKAEVEAYPTWITPDGRQETGVQQLSELAQL